MIRPLQNATVARAVQVLDDAGLSGSLLVRDIATGRELSFDAEKPFPLASVAKLPLAAAAMHTAHSGALDLAMPITIDHRARSRGGPGIARFAYPATLALGDLIRLAIELSDTSAADAILRIIEPTVVTDWLHSVGVKGIVIRHPVGDLYASLADQVSESDTPTVRSLVVSADRLGHPSPLPQLDLERANAGTARALADLLQLLWTDGIGTDVSSELRHMLNGNVIRHRLAPDFSSDTASWSSKTGSFMHLRHEAGVVEHIDGGALIVVALTRSREAAADQAVAEQAIGYAARLLHDELLSGD